MSDAQHYRTKAEVAQYQEKDPITHAKQVILDKKYASKKAIEEIDARVKQRVQECVDFADASPFADADWVFKGVYKQEDYPFIKD